MVRNAEDALLSLQAAEAALGEGEAYVSGGTGSSVPFAGEAGVFSDAGLQGLWTVAPPSQIERWAQSAIWATSSGGSRAANASLESAARAPRYIVEWLATLQTALSQNPVEEPVGEESGDEESAPKIRERVEIFRITAWGVGRTESARSMVQSTYGILIRDVGECPGRSNEPTVAVDHNVRTVLHLAGTDCRSSVVANPVGVDGVGRLSWREITIDN